MRDAALAPAFVMMPLPGLNMLNDAGWDCWQHRRGLQQQLKGPGQSAGVAAAGHATERDSNQLMLITARV
jgi:hypothetical protein